MEERIKKLRKENDTILEEEEGKILNLWRREASGGARDQSEILKEVPHYLRIHLFLSKVEKWKKGYGNVAFKEFGPATANWASSLQPSDISSHSQDPYLFSYYTRGKCFYERSFPALRRFK